MRSPIVGVLAIAAMACGTGGVLATGGGGQSGGSASQSEYRPPVPSVDKRCPKPPCPKPPEEKPKPPGPPEFRGGPGFDTFFDIFTELHPGPPFEPPPVPSIDKRFPPPVPSIDKRFPQGGGSGGPPSPGQRGK